MKVRQKFKKKEIIWHSAIIKGNKKYDDKTQWKESGRHSFPYPDHDRGLDRAVSRLWAYSVGWWIFLFMTQQRVWDECAALAKKAIKMLNITNQKQNSEHYSSFKHNKLLLHLKGTVCVVLDASWLKRHPETITQKKNEVKKGVCTLGRARFYTKGDCVKGALFALFQMGKTHSHLMKRGDTTVIPIWKLGKLRLTEIKRVAKSTIKWQRWNLNPHLFWFQRPYI